MKQKRKTGPDLTTRTKVFMRAKGLCEICSKPLNQSWGVSIHHRRPRGMGGTKRTNTNNLSNLVALCGTGTTGCHGWIESHREDAYERGYIIKSSVEDLESVIFEHGTFGKCLLKDDGSVERV